MYRVLGCAHATTTFHLARLRDDRGQGTVEYIGLILLIAGLMAIVATTTGGAGEIAKKIVGELKGSLDTVAGSGKKAP